jgi:aspartokinase/homoserine dehydrogenase 1
VSSLERDRQRAKGRKGQQVEVSVKGFATIDNVSLINIEGTGMVGVPGEPAATGLEAGGGGQRAATQRLLGPRQMAAGLPPALLACCSPPPPPAAPPGIASAVFSTVRDAGVNVIMISQASSEHSICFAVKSAEAPTAGASPAGWARGPLARPA